MGETQMLDRRWQLEVKGMAAIPTGFFEPNGFEVGPSAGIKLAIEMQKNLFVGGSFDWALWEQNKDIGENVSLLDAKPDDLYEEAERYNFLLTIDYDLTLRKNVLAERDPLKLRLGVGLGAVLIEGKADAFLKRSDPDYEILPYVGFAARVGGSLRWQLNDLVILFTEATYDFVGPFSIEVREREERKEVQGDIDFGSINIGAGVALEF